MTNGKNLNTKGKKREIGGRRSSAEESNPRAPHNNVDNDGGASRKEIDDPDAAYDPSIVAAIGGDDSEVKSFELAPEFSAGGSQVCLYLCHIHDQHLILLPCLCFTVYFRCLILMRNQYLGTFC